MIQSATGLVHTIAAFAALLLGAWVFLRPKFGIQHRVAGYAYTVAMVTLIITALLIYRLTGRFNLLHFFALVSTVTLVRALYFAFTRKPADKWLERHHFWMSWSYIGLFAAFIAETATRVGISYLYQHHGVRSFGWFWAIVILTMFGVCFFGALLVERNRKILNKYAGSR
ncbi:MAG: DUF2306 domain-containing protein [Limisphaerales bacterium]